MGVGDPGKRGQTLECGGDPRMWGRVPRIRGETLESGRTP